MSAPSSTSRPPDAKVWPRLIADPAHGPLPALLLLLTVLTGVIDAVSILGLGRVFVANMTGNVVFIAFAIAGVAGFSLASSVAALAGFLGGAFAGGLIIDRYGQHRGRLLRNACGIEFVIVAIAFVITLTSHDDASRSAKVAVSALCAVAMGIQNTTARKLAVPDLTTTVLTMTLTGIAADVRRSGFTVVARRVFAVLAMFVGGIAGAELFLHSRLAWALALALFLLAVVTIAAALSSRRPAAWNTV
ncbi:MAG TPA: YoaK family protein [Acidothermaceae bacterium]|nr:YoaK family protein [Acidothermaceae bacterium]